MNATFRIGSILVAIACTAVARAQPAAGLPADDKPVARIEAEGPLSYVGSLAFSPDGRTLYAAGWDKRVHVWTRDDRDGSFTYRRGLAFRIPLGPGQHGHINALALSPDGAWLAAGGYGMARNVAGFRESGKIWPKAAMSDEMRLDIGQIYVFHTTTREVRILRGHAGLIAALAFAPDQPGKPPLLISAAREESSGDPTGSVRVWNVETRQELARLDRAPVPEAGPPARWTWKPLPDPGGWKPDLSAWHSGRQLNQLRVAIAWGDNDDPARPRQGRFRVWDVETGRVSATAAVSPYVLTALATPTRERRVVTGAYGQIGVWTAAPGERPGIVQLDAASHYAPVLRLDGQRLPRAAALIGSLERNPSQAAFVVEHRQPDGANYELHVVDLNRGERVVPPLRLWSGAIRGPALAASPDGRRLAVAGATTNEIQILDTAQLAAGQAALVQTLLPSEAPAEPLRAVAFVANPNGEIGLALGESAPPAGRAAPAARLIFDIAQGGFSNDAAGWRPNAPDAGPLSVRPSRSADGRAVIDVVRDGSVARRITLEEGSQPTALAVCPAGPHFDVPLAAVASQFRGEPILSLYNADTGDELRRLTGHVEPIRSVAFSADGAFLASAGDDWTVCVWRLTDLGETLGRIGLLEGLAVDRQDGRLIVRDDPRGPFEPGDVLAAAVDRAPDGTEIPVRFDSTWDFYQHISRRKPGTTVALQVARDGRPQTLEAAVGQGIDERKPLFSLFVTPDRKSWIGWQPLGKYDAGSRAAEAYLGWHFNTGRADQPARFASAEQYREENFTPGLLRDLVAGQPPVADQAPEPKISLNLVPHEGDSLERQDYDGHLLSRTTALTAIVRVDGVPARSIRGLEWSFDGGEFQPAAAGQQTDRKAWEIDLSGTDWTARRVAQVAVRVLPGGTSRAGFATVRESVLYLPPAPLIALEGPPPLVESPQGLVLAREPQFTFSARVTARAEGQPFEVELQRQGQILERWTSADGRPLRIERGLELTPGGNAFELLARNSGAERQSRLETASRTWSVDFTPEPDPPAFVWRQVVPESGGSPFALTAADRGTKRFVVDVPRVRIQGRVEAPVELRTAEYIVAPDADDATRRALDRFEAGRKVFEIDEVLSLQPGRQLVRFRAATTAGREGLDDIEFEYRPKLPAVLAATLVIPGERPDTRNAAFGDSLDFVRRDELHTLELTADLSLPADVQPFRAEVLVDDQPLPADAVRVDRERGSLHASLAVTPDPGRLPDTRRIHVRLSNEWSPEPSVTAPLSITVRHPPRIAAVGEVEAEGLRIPRLTAAVIAPESRPVEALAVTVNGRSLPDEQIGQPARQDGGRWTIDISDIPLAPGANEIVLVARNGDGASPPHSVSVAGRAPASPLPEIVLVSPAVDSPVSSSRLTVEFRVRSARPLRMVDLVVSSAGGEQRRLHCLDRLGPGDAEGFATFKDTIDLAAGTNSISVEAVSDGLSVAGPVALNVLGAPIELFVERLVPQGDSGGALVPEYRPDGIYFNRPLTTGLATLHGRLVSGGGAPPPATYQLVRVWVNGFLRIAPVKDGAFEVPVVLNLSENNVQLEVPYLAVDEANRYRHQQVHVNCRAPEEGQHLHLLVIGADPSTDAERLRQRVETGFHLGRGNQAFVYQPPPRVLAGDRATRHHIRAQLTMLRWRMARRPGSAASNDVLMIYYEGRAVERDGEFVLLDQINWNDPARDPDTAVTSRFLSDYVNDTPGAHLVLLDVQSDQPNPLAAPERWPPHLGVLGVVWRSNAPRADGTGLISAIGTAMPVNGQVAASDEVRLRALEAAVRTSFAGAAGGAALTFDASDDLGSLLLARAAGGNSAP
ncbi:MAG TPA: hypothetical protein VML55_05585 [Planctomycetaceae bacterium]|nr:hypothetical protein [Planctomycetaceae bacterium]